PGSSDLSKSKSRRPRNPSREGRMHFGKLAGIVSLAGMEEKAGGRTDQLVFRQTELWNHEVRVRIVDRLPGEAAPDAVFVVVIVAVDQGGSLLGNAVGLLGDALVHDDELGRRPRLARLAQIAPEARPVGPPTPPDVVVSRWLRR